MDSTAIYTKLTAVFREVFDDEQLTPTPEMAAKDVPDWDSMNNIRLMVSIEEAFKIKFSVGEILNMKNVGDLVTSIQSKI